MPGMHERIMRTIKGKRSKGYEQGGRNAEPTETRRSADQDPKGMERKGKMASMMAQMRRRGPRGS